jgi:hypothetical protein
MTVIVCDICKKAVAGARRGDTYVSILDKDVCIPCSEDLLAAAKQQMLARKPYLFKDYQATLAKNLAQMTR